MFSAEPCRRVVTLVRLAQTYEFYSRPEQLLLEASHSDFYWPMNPALLLARRVISISQTHHQPG